MASLVTPLAMLVMVGAVVTVMLVVVLMVLVAGMRLPEAVGCGVRLPVKADSTRVSS